MKRTILTLVILIAATTLVFGQSKAEQEIRQTLNTIADALVKSDVAVLSNYYADSYTITNAQGETTGKAQRLELIKNTKRESFSYGDMNIRVFGNTAVVIANPTFTTVGANGQKNNVKDRATITMMKNGGRWQIVAVHSSNNLLNLQSGNQAETEKQLLQILTDWGNANGRRDTATVDKILANEFTLTSGTDGAVMDKAQYLEFVKNFPGEVSGIDAGAKVRVMSDVAIVTGRYTITPKAGGQPLYRNYTATFVRQQGRWMPVAFHSGVVSQ